MNTNYEYNISNYHTKLVTNSSTTKEVLIKVKDNSQILI